MGLFDFFKKKQPQEANQPVIPKQPELPSVEVGLHNAPIVPGNIKAIKEDCYVLHFETTGLNAFGDPRNKSTSMIVAIKCARFVSGQIKDSYFALIHPGRPIPDETFKASGINYQTIENAPSIDQVFPQFLSFIRDAIDNHTLILCYNSEFIGDFLKVTMQRQRVQSDFRLFDVMKLADKKICSDGYPKLKKAMSLMHIRDKDLNADIHKCIAIYNVAMALIDIPDKSVNAGERS